jgi:hypothetical protein
MNNPKRSELADKLTNCLLTEVYGEEFTNMNVEEDFSYFHQAWTDLSDRFYKMLEVLYGDGEILLEQIYQQPMEETLSVGMVLKSNVTDDVFVIEEMNGEEIMLLKLYDHEYIQYHPTTNKELQEDLRLGILKIIAE